MGKEVRARVALERDPDADVGPQSAEIIGNCRSGTPEIIASPALDSSTQDVETSVPGLRSGAMSLPTVTLSRVPKKARETPEIFPALSTNIFMQLPKPDPRCMPERPLRP